MKKFLENFWYYHKWKLLVAAMVVMVIINTVSELTGRESPDYSIGVVTVSDFPEETCMAISQAFSPVLPDRDGDGVVQVAVNVYRYSFDQAVTPSNLTEDDAVHLAADIQVGESCLFLSDEPEVMVEAGLRYQGACTEIPLLEALALNGFGCYLPETAQKDVIEALG